MSPTFLRAAAILYLAAAALTSLPITAGLLGWCPCGCTPEALVYQYPSEDGSEPSSSSDDSHDSHRCHGCHPLPYCPLLTDAPSAEWIASGSVALESIDSALPHHVIRLIRPPRA